MTRTLHKLSDTAIRKADLKPGRHSDGGGLYLNVKPGGSKSWVFMYNQKGRRRLTGLGSYPTLKLAVARQRAAELRELIANGGDPIALKQQERAPTFEECANRFLDTMDTQWRNEKHRAQWRMTLGDAYCSTILNKQIDEIDTDDILAILKPIWGEKQETASRLRGRIERVLDYGKARGWRSGENPALWRGHLQSLLPVPQKLQRGHHKAMPYDELPAFVTSLRQHEAMAARCLEFLILTACRSGEALGAQWAEIDLDDRVWTIPSQRMKAGRLHRVPISSAAMSVLLPLYNMRPGEFIFPGQREARPLSGMAMTMLMRRMNHDHYTVHGFRSTFRDWAGDNTEHSREVAEAALAHVQGDMTERAYRRRDALEKRRRLMEDWCAFLG